MTHMFKRLKTRLPKKQKKSKAIFERNDLSNEVDNFRASTSSSGEFSVSVSMGNRMKNSVIGRSKSLSNFDKLDSPEDITHLSDDLLKSLSDLSAKAISIHDPKSQLTDPVQYHAIQAKSADLDCLIVQTADSTNEITSVGEPLIKASSRSASWTSRNRHSSSTKSLPHVIDLFSSIDRTPKAVKFLNSLSSSDCPTLYRILKSIRNEHIKRFQQAFGFRLDLLLYVAIELSLTHPTWSDEELLSEFWRINRHRVSDTSFFLSLESQSSSILGAESRISDLLKVRTKDCLKCMICHVNMVSVLYLPCGHVVICGECSSSKSLSVCGVCDIDIEEMHNIFF